MASIKERNGKYCVIYSYYDADGKRRQKWETYSTKAEAKKRRSEIEYKIQAMDFVVPRCMYMRELIDEYIELYGKERWAISTYDGNMSLINNYILPIIGDKKLSDITTRFIEKYYKTLMTTKAAVNPVSGRPRREYVSSSTVRDVHKLLRNCFEQAVKWELMDKNPTLYATVPKHKPKKREIWTAETLMQAIELCDNEVLKLSLNLAFAGSLRIGELLGLTWDCIDISEEAIENNRAYIYVNKELQRVSVSTLEKLARKDVIYVFPTESKRSVTVRILKSPKTESSVRKIFLPRSVALDLVRWKKEQDEKREFLGDEYQNYNLVLATAYGFPVGETYIRTALKRLIEKHDLPPVVFHSLRHTSVTYKLKLNGGDIKAVQGDSGHSQINMVTDVYSHIIDDDRRKNAVLFEEAFYRKKNLNPSLHDAVTDKQINVPEGVDVELLAKVLANPEMATLLTSLAKTMEKR